ncbi:MAG: cupin domain-containing protein [Bacteroidota bacterium]
MVISKENSTHYVWGNQCDGWILVSTQDLTVIQERMPPGTAEKAHYHQYAQQFFYILEGQATFDVGEDSFVVQAKEGIYIVPQTVHRIYNNTDTDLVFVVTSQPTTKNDRYES